MPPSHAPIPQLTDLRGRADIARFCIAEGLAERLGEVDVSFDFHRDWNGGWRARVDVAGRGRLEYVLFLTPDGAVLALPHPMPERWRGAPGFAASDETRWTFDEAGEVVPLHATDAD